ncbi:hypothetical protein GE061_007736 [Apolygus lucorum]|uniref:SWIM-type domain-containing protein n=1 Tax=Apolygus lucorum TaxID=248454 RepID=A0A8S9WPC3_APOLU|nr:hypothetical protein GE061_007736 [Apolygus lucorum]
MVDCTTLATRKSPLQLLPLRPKNGKRMVLQRHCPPNIKQTQELALSLELYLVRQVGPTSWMVGTLGGDPHRVCVGATHSCSCPVFRSTRDICVHLAWILIRKLGLQMTNPLSYQLGMSERELNECLYPRREVRPKKKPRVLRTDKPTPVKRRTVQEGDQCPICLEEFHTKRSPVVYCKYSCGQGMHGGCMQVVAKHQEGPDLSCPLCRGHFSTMAELRQSLRTTFLPPLSKAESARKFKGPSAQKPAQVHQRFNETVKTSKKFVKSSDEQRNSLKRPKYLPKMSPNR